MNESSSGRVFKEHLRQESGSSAFSNADSDLSGGGASTIASRITEYGKGSPGKQHSADLSTNELPYRNTKLPVSIKAPLRIQKAANWLNAQLASPQGSRHPSSDSTGSSRNGVNAQCAIRSPSVSVIDEPGMTQIPTTPQQEWLMEPKTPSTFESSRADEDARVVSGMQTSALSPTSLTFVLPIKHENTQYMERMRKRHNCIRELYNTEYLFAQDMAVVVRLYMCASADVGLSVRQIDTLFSNLPQVLDISLCTVAILETHIPARVLQGDGTVLPHDVVADEHVRVGKAMCMVLNGQLYEAYEDYIHHNREQLQLYYELTQHLRQHPQMISEHYTNTVPNVNPKHVSAWLSHCSTRAAKFTTAWSLDSLLIKPVQRLSKYPLFLQTLLDCTSPTHNDYTDMERAFRRSKQYLDCVNARLGNSVS